MPVLPHSRVHQLHAQNNHHENCAKNFARLALREPAVNPCEDSADHQDVEGRKDGENQRGPDKQVGTSRSDSGKNAEAAEAADDCGHV